MTEATPLTDDELKYYAGLTGSQVFAKVREMKLRSMASEIIASRMRLAVQAEVILRLIDKLHEERP